MTRVLPPAIALMGPTASGKSALAIAIAQHVNGEIISVDSALVYRGMDIGTAKPTLAERLHIPHHLIDILDPAESFSAAQFCDAAQSLIEQILARGRVPILVGGTMLYFNALLHGLSALPPADASIRARLLATAAREGWDALHRRLQQVDPQAAERIHPHDPQRIQRALEVFELTGQPLSTFFRATPAPALPCRVQKFVLWPEDRARLHQRIAQRFQQMIRQGLIEEVTRLYQRGDLHDALPAVRAVGYRQVWAYLRGDCDLPTMIDKGIVATRQLAKRQLTWLRRETDAVSLACEAPERALAMLLAAFDHATAA